MTTVRGTRVILEPSMNTAMRAHPEYNRDFDWDAFNPTWYQRHNYDDVRLEDHEIIVRVRDHFCRSAGHREARRGVDVGAGPNLYPTLAMLPFCDNVDLVEYSESNMEWQREQLRDPDVGWEKFWEILRVNSAYRHMADGWRDAVSSRVGVHKGSIFELPERRWDMGTMFFVAESITTHDSEFRAAVRGFAAALQPGAPFAAAFMENSTGYSVDGREYPAVQVDHSHLEHSFSGVAERVEITRAEEEQPLRLGYTGMLVATGYISQ